MSLEDPRLGRRQYLITYSQADELKFPTRESFAKMIENEFNEGTSNSKVQFWSCSREPHKEGGFHYHCAVKLSAVKKWFAVKERITKRHGIIINFSDKHDYYISTYRYLTKFDKSVAHSNGHPNLTEAASPPAKRAIKQSRASATKRRSSITTGNAKNDSVTKKKKRLSNSNIADFIRKHNIKSYVQLFATAEERKEEGEKDISEFIFSRSEKHLYEIIKKNLVNERSPGEIEKR